MATSTSNLDRVDRFFRQWEAGEQEGRDLPNHLGRRRQPATAETNTYSRQVAQRRRRHEEALNEPGGVMYSFTPSLGIPASVLASKKAQKSMILHRCCQSCTPISNTYSFCEDSGYGLKDILKVEHHRKSCLGRLFPEVAHVMDRDLDYALPSKSTKENVVSSERVSKAVQSIADQSGKGIKEALTRAQLIIDNMASAVSKWLLKVTGVLLFRLFGRLFTSIVVHLGQVKMIHNATKRGYPLAFLPTHKSHLDYLILTFVLLNLDLKVPHIAAGDNLNIPVFSWLQRHLGGFFIKRKLDNGSGKDILYRAVLHKYMEELLVQGQNVEFFVEGSRSRAGKACLPKAGLMSILVDSVLGGIVPDVYIVPINISYDKMFERGLKYELMGQVKERENVFMAIGGIWRMFTEKLGNVRVDLSQPFSLREYISSHKIFELPWEPKVMNGYSENELRKRSLTSALARHVVHDFQKCSSTMATSMVSFLLLTKHRKGVSRGTLISTYEWLAMELRDRGRSVAFSGPSSTAVSHALQCLADLVTLVPQPIGSAPAKERVIPKLDPPNVVVFLHHFNQIVSTFLMESVIACSIQALVVTQEQTLEDNPLISKEELTEAALHLCGILSKEFIFTKPCVHIEGVINDAIEKLMATGVLVSREEYVSMRERSMGQWCEEEDEVLSDYGEHWLEVNSTSESKEHLHFLQSVLEPFLESYWVVASTVSQLEEGTGMEEVLLLKEIHARALKRIEQGTASFEETASVDPLRNAVHRFKEIGVLSAKEPSGSFLVLTDKDHIVNIAMDIVEYCR